LNNDYYIDTEDKFISFINKAKKQKAIAVDTEFLWRETYYPIIGLIQAAFSGNECYLIDTIAIKDISAFGEILTNNNIVKTLHDAKQDLQILSKACNYVTPVNIFDTRRAAGFAGLDHTISLVKLIEKLIGIVLPKNETTSDWTKRPLTEKQIQYAIDDVIYMCELRNILINKSKQNGFEHWLIDEMKMYENSDIYRKIQPDEKYLKLKGIKRLSLHQLKLTKHLAAWREIESEKRNIPKTFIFKDNILLKIVHTNPQSIQELQRSQYFPQERFRRYGTEIINVLKSAEISEENLKYIQDDFKIVINGNELQKLKQFIIVKAKEYNIAAELIATRADLVKFLEDKKTKNLENNQLLKTWRKDILVNLDL